MRMFLIGLALALAACQGPEPTARNPNGTLALAGSGNYVFNPTTGSFSRFSSDPKCSIAFSALHDECTATSTDRQCLVQLSDLNSGCSLGDGGSGDGGAAAGGTGK